MRTFLIGCSLITISSFGTTTAEAKTYNYDAQKAVQYALNNWNNSSVNHRNTDFTYFPRTRDNTGGNCTNFVSQSIMAGLSRITDRKKLWEARKYFQSDRGHNYGTAGTYGFEWFINDNGEDRGKAWTSAEELYLYAKGNQAGFKGLHFKYITRDSATRFMDYQKVKVGDIVFADWDADGDMEHTMIVTKIQKYRRGYNEIRLTYQTNDTEERGLGEINEEKDKKALFTVYRPTYYTTDGE